MVRGWRRKPHITCVIILRNWMEEQILEEMVKFIKSYKGQVIVDNHKRQRYEETQHIEEDNNSHTRYSNPFIWQDNLLTDEEKTGVKTAMYQVT